MMSRPRLLLETLEDLSSDKLKTFNWHLRVDGHASPADVEQADATTDTVDLVVARCGRDAVKNTLDILRKMKENNLAQELEDKLKGLEDSEKGPAEERNMRESDYSLQENNKGTGRAGIQTAQHLQQKKEHLFDRLHLAISHKLGVADVLQKTKHLLLSCESFAEEDLFQIYIQKLFIMDYRARQMKTDQIVNTVHLMDVQMAVFHCADGLLKQLMVTKLSQCQFALPLLVPHPFTQQIEFPLWTFRQITKKIRNRNNEIISRTHLIYKAQTAMVFFFRFGSVSYSKSQLMNSLINEKHDTFFHRHCLDSIRSRVLMDGVVEIAWFCPSGRNTDKFTECVAFCNLHGDAGDHEKQLQILTDMSSVNVVLLSRLDRNDRNMIKLQECCEGSKPLICVYTEEDFACSEAQTGQFKIGLKGRNSSRVSEELRRAIKVCLSESSHTFRLEDISKHSDIRVDEEDDEDCRRGREAAEQMMSLLENKDLTQIKDSFLPHQGKLWHQWSQKNKELHRPRGDETEMDMKKIRQQQHDSEISEFMELFIKQMCSNAEYIYMFFLQWLRILLDEYTSPGLSALHHKYHEKWSIVAKLKESNNNSEQLKSEQTELERISEDFQAANFGVEHIMREIGQIYESCSSVQKNKKDLQVDFSSLPSLAAEMMISGFPLELMDGDAACVPLVWISAVLDQLIQKLGDQRVFVLSVLGLRGSGKSTMLNAMFGLEFAVSAGRTTRGAFMQLVRVSDEMKTQMNTDYILVVETEGLRGLELTGRSTRHHDSELATFVVGLGNLTLINIFGENLCKMQEILQIVVQAFLRMKKVRLNPSCVFVHQNVSDITAGERNMEERRRLQETLDEMTKLAAKKEDCDEECFSDIIRCDVQNDVKYFTQLWEGSPPMAPPNPDYCENIKDLKMTIMSHASRSQGMMLKDLKDCIKDLWKALLNEESVFYFRNSQEISASLENECSKLTSVVMENESIQRKQIENDVIHEVDLQREQTNTSEVERTMSEPVEKDMDNDILIQRKTSKINEHHENTVRKKRKRKFNEVLKKNLKKKSD